MLDACLGKKSLSSHLSYMDLFEHSEVSWDHGPGAHLQEAWHSRLWPHAIARPRSQRPSGVPPMAPAQVPAWKYGATMRQG